MKKGIFLNVLTPFVFPVVLFLVSCGQHTLFLQPPTSEIPNTTPTESVNHSGDNSFQTDEIRANEVVKMPDESYIGTWYTDKYKLDDLTVFDVSCDKIDFSMGIYRITSITASAKISGNEIYILNNGATCIRNA